MTIDALRSFLLYSTLLNYAILFVWFIAFVFAHDWMHALHGRWFHLSRDQFDALHYGAMSLYKCGILLLNLVPLIALWLVR